MRIYRKKIIEIIKYYGFIECGQILNFLHNVCEEIPEKTDLLWIYSKINNCLRIHNNNSEYFDALIDLRSEIELNLIRNNSHPQ